MNKISIINVILSLLTILIVVGALLYFTAINKKALEEQSAAQIVKQLMISCDNDYRNALISLVDDINCNLNDILSCNERVRTISNDLLDGKSRQNYAASCTIKKHVSLFGTAPRKIFFDDNNKIFNNQQTNETK